MSADLNWSDALVLTCGAVLVLGGIIATVVGLVRSWHRKNYMRIPYRDIDTAHRTGMFSVGRDVRDRQI